MTGISSYNRQLTPVYLLHTEKRGKPVWLFVFNMAFPTSPLSGGLWPGDGSSKKVRGAYVLHSLNSTHISLVRAIQTKL